MKRTALIPVLAAATLAVPFLVFADDSFVPLTSIPGITSLTGSPTLPAFLNNLYRICIGIAAFAAIARFIYAGYTIMTDSGSVTKNKKAREMIQNTVIGLILVLSPAVVFGIINPKILDLTLDFKGLQSNNGTGGAEVCYPACEKGQACNGGKCVTGNNATPGVTANTCDAYDDVAVVPGNGLCTAVAGESYVQVAAACCKPAPENGYQCCGKAKGQ